MSPISSRRRAAYRRYAWPQEFNGSRNHFSPVRNVADAAGDAFAYPSATFVGDRALLTYFNCQGGISLVLQGIPVKWFYE
mgnify:CR=1 FL=1